MPGRALEQATSPVGSESQPQPTTINSDGKSRDLTVPQRWQTRQQGEDSRRGLAPTPPLPWFSGQPLGSAWRLVKGKQIKVTPLRKKSVPDAPLSLRGDSASPLHLPQSGEGPAPLKQAVGPSGLQGWPAPLPLVDLLVLQEVLLLDKALLTLRAAVGPLARVDTLVPHQVGRVAEALAAVTTDEGAPAFPPRDVAGQGDQAVG